MGQESVDRLNVIKTKKDVTQCCSAMFSLWRERQPKASWNQLIEAMKEVKLDTLADGIKMLLLPSPKQQLRNGFKRHIEHKDDQNMDEIDTGISMILDY